MRWAFFVPLAVPILAALSACGALPPDYHTPAYQQALADCKQQARAARLQEMIDQGFTLNPDWESVDPCLEGRGFTPPPY